jgi:ABC-type glutathione transport system ATPase component
MLGRNCVLRLLADIRKRLGLTVLFFTHDLCVASQVCDSIVMKKGHVAVPGRQWESDNEARAAAAAPSAP